MSVSYIFQLVFLFFMNRINALSCIALLLLASIHPSLSAMVNKIDADCDGADCYMDTSSYTSKAETRSISTGSSAFSQIVNYQTDVYNSTTQFDVSHGQFNVKTPEIRLFSNARDYRGRVKLEYNTKQILGEPEIVEDEEGNAWLEIENRTLHFENADIRLAGNGSMSEDVTIAVAGKNRKFFEHDVENGNFTFNQSLALSGLELRKSLELLNKPDVFTESSEEATFRATAGGVMK